MLLIVIALLGGLFLGIAIGCPIYERLLRKRVNGSLRIDKSDPEEAPYIFLELKENPDVLEQSKYVTLEVVAKNYVSQQ